MTETVAIFIVRAVGAYLAVGLLFAVPFVVAGAGRIDPAARKGTIGFRLLILPGSIALWPVLAWRWLRGIEAPPEERNAHRDAARRGGSKR